MTTKRRQYRYRDNSCGVTRISLERMRLHLHKIGKPLLVRAYRFYTFRKKWGWIHHEAVMVKGTRGSVRFEGFCWDYRGEGPRGLRNLLLMLGVPLDIGKGNKCRTMYDQETKSIWREVSRKAA